MNIDKAIEILESEAHLCLACETLDRCKAMKLGVEALKYLQRDRAFKQPIPWDKLLGEIES